MRRLVVVLGLLMMTSPLFLSGVVEAQEEFWYGMWEEPNDYLITAIKEYNGSLFVGVNVGVAEGDGLIYRSDNGVDFAVNYSAEHPRIYDLEVVKTLDFHDVLWAATADLLVEDPLHLPGAVYVFDGYTWQEQDVGLSSPPEASRAIKQIGNRTWVAGTSNDLTDCDGTDNNEGWVTWRNLTGDTNWYCVRMEWGYPDLSYKLGEIQDADEITEYMGNVYIGTTNPAGVLRWYENNNSAWWSALNMSASTLAGTGVFFLVNNSGTLYAGTYGYDTLWSFDGSSWTNVSSNVNHGDHYNGYLQYYEFEGDIYVAIDEGHTKHIDRMNADGTFTLIVEGVGGWGMGEYDDMLYSVGMSQFSGDVTQLFRRDPVRWLIGRITDLEDRIDDLEKRIEELSASDGSGVIRSDAAAPYVNGYRRSRGDTEWIEFDPDLTIIYDVASTDSGNAQNHYAPSSGTATTTTTLRDVFTDISGTWTRLWINDTDANLIYTTTDPIGAYNILLNNGTATAGRNLTIEFSGGSNVKADREVRIKEDRAFTWLASMDLRTYTTTSSIRNNIAYAMHEVFSYWAAAEDADGNVVLIDPRGVEVVDRDNNQILSPGSNYFVDYTGIGITLPSLAASDTQTYRITYTKFIEGSSILEPSCTFVDDGNAVRDGVNYVYNDFRCTNPNAIDFDGRIYIPFDHERAEGIIVEDEGGKVYTWRTWGDSIQIDGVVINSQATLDFTIYFRARPAVVSLENFNAFAPFLVLAFALGMAVSVYYGFRMRAEAGETEEVRVAKLKMAMTGMSVSGLGMLIVIGFWAL